MKKTSFALLILTLLLSACSPNQEVQPAKETAEPIETETTAESEETESGVGVDKGLLNVTVTIPADFFEEEEREEIIAEANQEETKEATVNEDGSITYKMTKREHKDMMKEMKEGIIESVDELINDETLASIKDITYNKDFTAFTITAEQEGYENSFDGFSVLTLGISGMLYQLFDGVDAEKINVQLDTISEATGESFATVNYPRDFEDFE